MHIQKYPCQCREKLGIFPPLPDTILRVNLDRCSKNGDLAEALRLYEEAKADSVEFNQHHYNVLLYLCSLNTEESGENFDRFDKGFEIFKQMGVDKVDPNEATFTNMSRLAASKEDPELGFGLVKRMKDHLYAAVSSKCLLVTNDEMRDHLFNLLGNSFFPRWKEKHQVRLKYSSEDGLTLHMPPPYSIVIQESEQGRWHIPTVTGDDLEAPRQWICATRARPDI
ncbi:proteinaceous RNase P 1, chloroplastic/mitochondrial-like [Salvia splendens]|uniref:proteinaceous RNase P 1, chloroplastic/mitochondrial-like n=1 Tax=Salvia splendens TaxID=180675 RepID=UPI001C27BDA1|nr:proteinaceous RNase P 1, chloroplastic/mitochondrial-like [Salvia splendens]